MNEQELEEQGQEAQCIDRENQREQVIAELQAELTRMHKSYVDCYHYSENLFKVLAPQCKPMAGLSLILTQIDNWCAGAIELRKAVKVCCDINDSGETYNAPNADAAQALANLFSLVEDSKPIV